MWIIVLFSREWDTYIYILYMRFYLLYILRSARLSLHLDILCARVCDCVNLHSWMHFDFRVDMCVFNYMYIIHLIGYATKCMNPYQYLHIITYTYIHILSCCYQINGTFPDMLPAASSKQWWFRSIILQKNLPISLSFKHTQQPTKWRPDKKRCPKHTGTYLMQVIFEWKHTPWKTCLCIWHRLA